MGPDPRLRATRFGTKKIPPPITIPITIATESASDNLRGNPSMRKILSHRRDAEIAEKP
jgi:hypothetical protein